MCAPFARAKLHKREFCEQLFCSKFIYLRFIFNGNFADIILFIYLKVVALWL